MPSLLSRVCCTVSLLATTQGCHLIFPFGVIRPGTDGSGLEGGTCNEDQALPALAANLAPEIGELNVTSQDHVRRVVQ
mgnify:CR=1 FL=1